MKIYLRIIFLLLLPFILTSCSHSIADRYGRSGTEKKIEEVDFDMTDYKTLFVVEKEKEKEIQPKTVDAFFGFSKIDPPVQVKEVPVETFYVYVFNSINEEEINEKINELNAFELNTAFKTVFDPPFYFIVTAEPLIKTEAEKLLGYLKDAGYPTAELKTNLPE